jgi:hypothetical protein
MRSNAGYRWLTLSVRMVMALIAIAIGWGLGARGGPESSAAPPPPAPPQIAQTTIETPIVQCIVVVPSNEWIDKAYDKKTKRLIDRKCDDTVMERAGWRPVEDDD